MALPFAPLIPLALRFGPRLLLLATTAWAGTRLVQSGGDPKKAFVALREDVIRAYQFFTNDQTAKLKKAGDTLQKRGGDAAVFANTLLALIEAVSGIKLTETKKVITQTRTVIDAWSKLKPAERVAAEKAVGVKIPEVVQQALVNYMYNLGLKTLNETQVAGMDLPQFLSRKYIGLFYIGRSGKHLTAEEVDRLATDFRHYHAQIGGEAEQPLVDWYTSVGVSLPESGLIERLKKCPEVSGLAVDVRYIAYALNQPVPGLTFGPLDEALLKRLEQ